MKSSASPTCTGPAGEDWTHTWSGSKIRFKYNDVLIELLESGFTDYEYCVSGDEIDIANDQFKLESTGDHGVS